jgi:integrase
LTKVERKELWHCLFLTRAETEALLEYVERNASQPWVHPMVTFAAHTGARRSELVRLQIHDIDLNGRTAILREKKRAKSKRTLRRVPLSERLCRVLREWLAAHPGGSSLFAQQEFVGRSKTRRTGATPITHDEAHDHFRRTLAGSGWEVLRGWHVLRHSFASNCAASGIDQRLIDEWMGHQTEEMRKRYRHLFPDQQRVAIERVFG